MTDPISNDDYALWADGTCATIGEVRSGHYTHMSDDYEIISWTDTARLIEIDAVDPDGGSVRLARGRAMPSHCHCLLRLAGAGIDLSLRRIASLASRPRLRVSRSLPIDRRGSAGVSTAASARLAGGRGDAVASPALPLRIAPCRCDRVWADRHRSLASRRSLRIAGSLRLARADRTRLSTAPVSLASRPRLRVSRSLRIDRRSPTNARLARGAAMPAHCEHQLRIARAPGPADRPMTP